MQDLRDMNLKELDQDMAKKLGEQTAMDAVVPRKFQGVVIHEGDVYELIDKRDNKFRLRVTKVMPRNRIMMKLL